MFEKRKNWQFGEWMWGSWGWAGLKFWGIGDCESGVGAVGFCSLILLCPHFSLYLRYAPVPLQSGSLGPDYYFHLFFEVVDSISFHQSFTILLCFRN